MMHVGEIKAGARFIDSKLTSHPAHRRIHEVIQVNGFDSFDARHLSTGKVRNFPLGADQVDHLVEVRRFPVIQSNLDGLVGDRTRVELVDGGAFTSVVTGVTYSEIVIDGAVFRYIDRIEFDHSSATSYDLPQIRKIVRIGRAR